MIIFSPITLYNSNEMSKHYGRGLSFFLKECCFRLGLGLTLTLTLNYSWQRCRCIFFFSHSNLFIGKFRYVSNVFYLKLFESSYSAKLVVQMLFWNL